MALISINLGFINLLPIPMLDGGHLLFYGVEAIQRRPVSPQVQEWAYRSGLAVLLAMMVLVTFNDLFSFGLWDRLSGLIGLAVSGRVKGFPAFFPHVQGFVLFS